MVVSILTKVQSFVLSAALMCPLVVACSPGSCEELEEKAWVSFDSLSQKEINFLADNC